VRIIIAGVFIAPLKIILKLFSEAKDAMQVMVINLHVLHFPGCGQFRNVVLDMKFRGDNRGYPNQSSVHGSLLREFDLLRIEYTT
jgi:hypothetical protein